MLVSATLSGYTLRTWLKDWSAVPFSFHEFVKWTLPTLVMATNGALFHSKIQEELRIQTSVHAWVKVFRIIPEFRNLRLTFHWKSASKCWIREIIIDFSIYIQSVLRQLTIKIGNCEYLVGILQVLRFEFQKFRILEIWNFTHVHVFVLSWCIISTSTFSCWDAILKIKYKSNSPTPSPPQKRKLRRITNNLIL